NGVMLLIDGAESSYLDLSDPAHLVFEYMQQMMAVLEETMPGARVRAVHLGAAGCALPRAVEARWPASRQIAVEWDALLAGYGRHRLDQLRAPLPRVRVANAGEATDSRSAGSKEVLVRDVSVERGRAEHVRPVEFTRAVASTLAEGGGYKVN